MSNEPKTRPALDESLLRRAPKVLLHEHLDGGLRPKTCLELAESCGYEGLPETDPEALARSFAAAMSCPRVSCLANARILARSFSAPVDCLFSMPGLALSPLFNASGLPGD